MLGHKIPFLCGSRCLPSFDVALHQQTLLSLTDDVNGDVVGLALSYGVNRDATDVGLRLEGDRFDSPVGRPHVADDVTTTGPHELRGRGTSQVRDVAVQS